MSRHRLCLAVSALALCAVAASGQTPSAPAATPAARPGAAAAPAAGRRPVAHVPPQITVAGTVKSYTPVTDQMLVNPPEGDWLMHRRDYAGWSHSPLKQIDTQNVDQLQLKWSWAMSEGGTAEPTPLVHDGVMFLPNANDIVQALDVRTGKLIWEHKIGPATPVAVGASANRSLALYGDKVFMAANDAMLYALDAKTGKIVWQTDIADGTKGRAETAGPIVIHGKVLVGMTGCGRRPETAHCYISAYDANTGARVWKFLTVALKGTPGGETWNDIPDEMRQGTETWISGTYDPVLNTTYWGTAQAKPHRRDERKTSAAETLYGNSTLALDPDTGKLKWFYDHAPGESLDLDEAFERVLIDHGDQKTAMTIGKTGILWKLDRVSGKYLDSAQTVFQNVYTKIDKKTGVPTYRPDIIAQHGEGIATCPSAEGGHDWQATSYDKANDLLIIPLSQTCMIWGGNAGFYYMPGVHRNMGKLAAYRTSDMKEVWSFQQRAPFLTAALTTDGGLVFIGDWDRTFKAVDTRTGKIIWSVQLGNTVQGFPTTFSVDGKQYVAVTTAMGGGSPEQKPIALLTGEVHRASSGQQLYVFALPDRVR